jgi:transcriptional regulator with XRE-family HTH domain
VAASKRKAKRPVGRPPGRTGKLGRWVATANRKRSEVAKQLGISGRHFDALCRGDKIPSADLIEKISRATGGSVTNAYWASVNRTRKNAKR